MNNNGWPLASAEGYGGYRSRGEEGLILKLHQKVLLRARAKKISLAIEAEVLTPQKKSTENKT